MHIVRVNKNSITLFDFYITSLGIHKNQFQLISSGANGNYGKYINPDVTVYGFFSENKDLYDRLEEDVRLNSSSKQTYVSLGPNEFFF